MKAFFKFTLLLALIVVGRFAKQPAPPAVARVPAVVAPPAVTLVHQVFTSEPVPSQSLLSGPEGSPRLTDTTNLSTF